jgi:hypothetical protein
MRISLNGKFIGIMDIPKHYIGDATAIFNELKSKQPKDIKKLNTIIEKQSIDDFEKAIALKDKPVINFIIK